MYGEIRFEECECKRCKPEEYPSFGSVCTNYMFSMKYKEGQGWYEPKIEPYRNLDLSPTALCLHYGQTIFEGMKVSKINDKRVLFRPEENFKRFNRSAKRMVMPEVDVDFMIKATQMLIEKENDEWFYDNEGKSSLYIRPFMIATEPVIGARPSNEYLLIIMMCPNVNSYFESSSAGVSLKTETNHMRVAAKGTGEAKNGGNYGGAFQATKNANKDGYSHVLWLDPHEQKYIEEAGVMNVFFVVDNKLITPQLNGSILKGITRDSVINLAKELDYEVEEKRISIDDILTWYHEGKVSEAFSTGTAASIQQLSSITHNDQEMSFNYNNNSFSTRMFKYLDGLKQLKIEDKYNYIYSF